MRIISTKCVVFFLSLTMCTFFGGMAFGQTPSINAIGSTYPVAVPLTAGATFTSLTIMVGYPTGLPANNYIAGAQFSVDFQTFYAAYPNPKDPPEAILASILQSILNKYPQIAGGTLSAVLTADVLGVLIPGEGGGVAVSIGTFSSNVGTALRQQHSGNQRPVKRQDLLV